MHIVQSKVKKILYCITLILFFSDMGVYLYVDFKGAEKGIKSNLFSISLPNNLYPFVDNHSSFVLKDTNGIEVFGIGFRYADMEFTIQDILAYGYNKSSIIVLCKFSEYEKLYVSYMNEYAMIDFREISCEKEQNAEYRWVKINNNDYYTYTRIKSWLLLLAIFLVILFFSEILKLRVK